MNYSNLSIEERCCIREYCNSGKSFREIASLIGRSPATISREINRNKSYMDYKPAYYPITAQKKYKYRRRFCHRDMFGNEELVKYIENKLLLAWSPEQIANTPCELDVPSFKTIYCWLYEGYLLHGNVKVLRKKGKTRKRLGNGGRFITGKSIRKRDKSVYRRKEIGHGEVDTVISGIGKSKACFATLAGRKTRYYIAVWIPNRKAETMENAIVKALSHLPNEMAKSITCDRGQRICELAKHREKTKLRDVFCRSVLCVAKRHKRKQQRTLERILP